MSIQPSHDLLQVLRATLSKVDADPAPSPSLLELRRILVRRIEVMEGAQGLTGQRTIQDAPRIGTQPQNPVH